MLEKSFFEMEAQKLINQYGQKAMSDHKMSLIYRAMKNLDNQEFSHIIDEIIGNSKYSPTLDDFRAKARTFLGNKPKQEKTPCQTCNSEGYFTARYRDGRVGEFAFQCHCVNGAEYQAYQKWEGSFNKHLTNNYASIKVSERSPRALG